MCSAAAGILALGHYWLYKRNKEQITALKSNCEKYLDNYHLLNHWLEVKSEGKNLAAYFKDRGYTRIAVYGLAELANRLWEDLAGSGIEIVYGIDRDVSCSISRIDDVYSLQDILPEADAIVVTPCYAFESIKKDLAKKITCPVISLEEVVWSV